MKVQAYKCDSCGCLNENSDNFRLVVGNVMVPDQGGLIGNNIFFGKLKDKFECTRKHKMHESLDSTIRVYGRLYCVSCFLTVSGIPQDGENTY